MKKYYILEFFKYILNIIFRIIIFPFRLIFNFFVNILKRFKFSIAFKISTSYMLLYIIVIMIVSLITSLGFFVFEIKKLENNVIYSDLSNIINKFPDYNEFQNMVDKNDITKIKIFDDKLNAVYSSGGRDRFSNNIIATIENILLKNEYVFSSTFEHNGYSYYINIYYSSEKLVNDTKSIALLVLSSGIFGLLIFAPIVSRTSYKLIGPIKKMTEITNTITVNNINTRLDVKGTQDELKELSQTFNEMMDRIEEGYKLQQQFVSDASHELRTPIAVIKGYVNMLDRWGKKDKEVLEESIGAIKNEADNMQDLIEKLLFIARSDRQTLLFAKEDIRICDILFEIEKETNIIDSNHNFIYKFHDDALVYADKNRIKQSIRIFIENAIKFTPKGEDITITSYIDDDYYIISILDTGVGIDKQDLSNIFNRLYRAEQSRSRNIGGHGLGLSIAKIIILGHKGKIKVKSTVGIGSEFQIMLPYLEKIS